MTHSASYLALPVVGILKKKMQSLALLEAVLSPDWESRYFSFNALWDEKKHEMFGSMQDGQGSHFFILFSTNGAIGKVYDCQADLEELEKTPAFLADFIQEPEFCSEDATFFFWRLGKEAAWSALPDNLEEYSLLGFLVNDWEYYHQWAEKMYDRKIDQQAVKEIFKTQSVSNKALKALSPALAYNDLLEDFSEILGHSIDDF